MSLFTRDIANAPRVVSQERADEVVTAYQDLSECQRELLAGVAGASSYLTRLLMQEQDWLLANIGHPADAVFDEILTLAEGEADPSVALRHAKRRVALMTALGDLGGCFSLGEVTGYLTRFADYAVETALKSALLAEQARGKLPHVSQEDVLARAAGVAVLAMGKMGAFELNYSSDIDLIVLFDETQHEPDDFADLRAGFVRATRRMVKILSDVTEHGYVFRTDLRLRPDPAVTPVCVAMEAAERYYESLGRTWERAAFIKARVCAGDLAAGEAFLERLGPFVWRRHLDFAAVQDAQDMVNRIREHKGLLGEQKFPGFDIKLGPGGIREIEFFAQTQQLIFGGRDPSLRLRTTLGTLGALVEAGHVPAEDAETLGAAYEAHRALEHRLQMLEDAQTHHIPQSAEAITQLAALAGAEDEAALEAETLGRAAHVHSLISDDEDENEKPAPEYAFAPSSAKVIERWEYLPALNASRAQELFRTLKPEILSRLSAAAHPDEALAEFDAFLSGLPAGVQLFSLFKENAQLLDLLVDICATSPRLASYLGRNSGVFDAVLGQDFFGELETAETLEAELSAWLAEAADYEDVLDTARKWRKEHSFRTGVHLLRGLTNPAGAAASYSAMAEACLCALMPHVEAEVARRYGPAPGQGVAVIAMGKLGSKEMTVSSDLDLIVVYDAGGATFTQGPKELAVSTYFAKFTQTLILALTAQTAQGQLYEVDMRLRPSGRKGPVAVSLESFSTYQKKEAWTWESLALTRGRVVAGCAGLVADVARSIREALELPRDPDVVRKDVREMRARIFEAKPGLDIWDVKSGPGGLLDLELLVQTGLLLERITGVQSPFLAVERLEKAGFLQRPEAEEVLEALKLRQHLQQLFRLISETGFSPEQASRGASALVLEGADVGDFAALVAKLEQSAQRLSDMFAQKLASA